MKPLWVPRMHKIRRSPSMRSTAALTLLLALARCSALKVPAPSSTSTSPLGKPTRRTVLAMLPALAAPSSAFAAATGGGFSDSQVQTLGGGPPKLAENAFGKLTKGEPGPDELKRLAIGYQRLQYLLANWEKETTVCIRGCKGKYENCGCTRDPLIVQSYMGYKSMNDPLFKAGDRAGWTGRAGRPEGGAPLGACAPARGCSTSVDRAQQPGPRRRADCVRSGAGPLISSEISVWAFLVCSGDLMMRASTMVQSDKDFERYNEAMDKWNEKADAGNVMAYVSSARDALRPAAPSTLGRSATPPEALPPLPASRLGRGEPGRRAG